MKRPSHKLYDTAENLFIDQGMTCAAISETLGITEATLSKWRAGMQWDHRRQSVLSSPAKIREILTAEVQSLAEGNKPTIDTDALSKVAKALSYFDGKVSLGVVVAVLKEVDSWGAQEDPGTAIKMTEYHRRFITYRAAQDSAK